MQAENTEKYDGDLNARIRHKVTMLTCVHNIIIIIIVNPIVILLI
jgi:hypothetical protein